ncbi:MAG: hypothetical protein NVSMB39_5900 [Candidatus Saccharimonadales bacterium]
MSTQTPAKYSIMEAAKLSGLPESTLRYYESIGLIDKVARDPSSKHRVYSEDDVNLVVAVACLSATGMSIDDMRVYLGNRGQGADKAGEQMELLAAQAARLKDEAHYLKLRQRYVETKISYWQAVAAGDTQLAGKIGETAGDIAKELKLPKE